MRYDNYFYRDVEVEVDVFDVLDTITTEELWEELKSRKKTDDINMEDVPDYNAHLVMLYLEDQWRTEGFNEFDFKEFFRRIGKE